MPASFRSPSKVARRLKLTPLVARAIENWPSFMYHYALGLVPRTPYRFRDGARLRIGRGVDHVPLIEIFLRQEYGRMPDDAVILDAGASIGTFSIHTATRTQNTRLYAFEPLPSSFRLLRENVRLNGVGDSVACVPLALAGDETERTLFTAGTGFFFPTLIPPRGEDAVTRARVACTSLGGVLDAYGLDRVDVLKMDIEGGEYDVLYRTPPSSFARIRQIRMEYHDLDQDRRNVGALRAYLLAQGYRSRREQVTTPTNGLLWMERDD